MHDATALALLVLLVGSLVVASMLIKAWLARIGIPAAVGFMGLGMLLRVGDHAGGYLPPLTEEGIVMLGKLGVVVLLFRVGLESKLHKLLGNLRRASLAWLVGVAFSGLAGYVAARHFLQLDMAPSLVVAVAMTATSVGIPSAIWQRSGRLETNDGQLFLDVAEMDDISGVILMGLLFAILPALAERGDGFPWATLGSSAGTFALKLAAFGALCLAFARWIEKPVRCYLQKLEHRPDPMLSVLGIGIVIAAIAGLLGFSLAIGAFFAGLIFSCDPKSVREQSSFDAVYELLFPFFFFAIGLQMSVGDLGAAVLPALVLVAAAIVGKFVGTAAPVLPMAGTTTAAVLGVSMIPRAEISMIIMQKGLNQAEVVSKDTYTAMVLVSMVTCLIMPIVLRWMIARYIPDEQDNS